MIVVDTNVITLFFIPGSLTLEAEMAAHKDEWCAPLLWRSEFRNVLALYIRKNLLSFDKACQYMKTAEKLLWNREYSVRSDTVLQCVRESRCSAYDCEFVALARDLGLKLVTTDGGILSHFPKNAVHLREYVALS